MNLPEWIQWLGVIVTFIALVWLFLRTGIQTELIYDNRENIVRAQRYVKFKENENMYLVGDLSFRSLIGMRSKFKHDINEEDMAKAKNDHDYQIIDLANKTFFDPSNDKWVEIPTE